MISANPLPTSLAAAAVESGEEEECRMERVTDWGHRMNDHAVRVCREVAGDSDSHVRNRPSHCGCHY